jgi:hypothetical protein
MGDQYDDPGPDLRWVLVSVSATILLLSLAILVAAVWQNTVYAAAVPLVIIAVVLGMQAMLASLPRARVPAAAAARAREPRRPGDDGLDPAATTLLRRAQSAIGTVTSSEVCRAGLLDRAAVSTALASQESDIAAALRDQARIRARRAELTPVLAGPMASAVSASQIEAAQLAESSITARVEALERYAAEVAEADAAYSDRRQAAQLAELQGQHLDLLARTAADEHGIAEIEAMSQQARTVSRALRDPVDDTGDCGGP